MHIHSASADDCGSRNTKQCDKSYGLESAN
jgi:hypothetical protein